MSKLAVVHGWSDSGSGFFYLIESLINSDQTDLDPVNINLADYISMDDKVNFDDIAEQFNRIWQAKVQAGELSKDPFSNDVIVHSTGALVVRYWLTKYFKPETSPIKRFVMLAPANFGSYLARRGQSVVGRLFKGGNKGNFTDEEKNRRKFVARYETGEYVLRGLELASPFTWELAKNDLFADQSFYGEGKILATVLIGNKGWSGINSFANEDGSDGTVYMSTANLDCARLRINLTSEGKHGLPQLEKINGKVAYAVMNNENHAKVFLVSLNCCSDSLGELITMVCPLCNSSGFSSIIDLLKRVSVL